MPRKILSKIRKCGIYEIFSYIATFFVLKMNFIVILGLFQPEMSGFLYENRNNCPI